MTNEVSQTIGGKDGVQTALNDVSIAASKLFENEQGSREQLVQAARELLHAAEHPFERACWSIWAEQPLVAATRIAIDLKLFETTIADGGRSKSIEELAAPTGASPKLVERIARICVNARMLDMEGTDRYAPNKLTETMVLPECVGGIVFHHDACAVAFAKLPEYLRNINYQNPQDPSQSPWSTAEGVDYTFINQDQSKKAELFQSFHDFIHGIRKHRPQWTDIYPFQDRVLEGAKSDGNASAFVDIGGSLGHILKELHDQYPEYKGRLILQELPHAVHLAKQQGLEADGRIEAMAHDMFTPQPIKGARAYYMRSVLHDWPDHKVLEVLQQLKAVMTPGYSRLLLNEFVIRNEKPDWRASSVDVLLMVLMCAHERSEREWRQLISQAGLTITNIYTKYECTESVIEVMLENDREESECAQRATTNGTGQEVTSDQIAGE